ncbi:MAG: NAD-binding protein [Cyanobacteria bacterium P01_F01_bin.150]
MINLHAFESAHSHYPVSEMPFLQRQKQWALETKPYAGLKILHNLPLTIEVLFKVEVLAAGGAELTVTNPSFMAPKSIALDILNHAGIDVRLSGPFNTPFDMCLDCCGELLGQVIPQIGAIEITRTGAIRYGVQPLQYPVISIDDSQVKQLEAILGTGDAFVRAFQELTGEVINHRKFMVVGYGKVGQGIAHALRNYTQSIVIVDCHPGAIAAAKAQGFTAVSANDSEAVEAQVVDCFGVVTATGRENVISQQFNPQVFKGRYLANMGGEDEFGDGFALHDVMCNKQPINFAIAHPTLMRYLDPVFYAHNAAIGLLRDSPLQPLVHPFPAPFAEEIVAEWETYFGESLSDALPQMPLVMEVAR